MLEARHIEQYERTKALLAQVRDADAKENGQGWSIKQVLGHMLDSCSMNHQRIARRQQGQEVSFPGYNQEDFVAQMGYADLDFATLRNLWEAYNVVLLHAFSRLTARELDGSYFSVQGSEKKPYREWISFYFEHMHKHEEQLCKIIESNKGA
jgi:uncharacterized damage-inducible protein DinB